jgi:RNA polymerase sigma-70 factor (ECF subfamily)
MTERDNQSWINDLKSQGEQQNDALKDLRVIVERGLSHALTRWLKVDDPLFQSLVEEATQETLIKVLDNLDSFEGRSKFTTWVYKIAVRVALTDLRRKRWENVSLDEIVEDYQNENIFPDKKVKVEEEVFQGELVEKVKEIINHELTEKQRTALIALGFRGMSLLEVAERLNTNRNALYKLLHDARKRLKKRLRDEGLEISEIFAAFEA